MNGVTADVGVRSRPVRPAGRMARRRSVDTRRLAGYAVAPPVIQLHERSDAGTDGRTDGHLRVGPGERRRRRGYHGSSEVCRAQSSKKTKARRHPIM